MLPDEGDVISISPPQIWFMIIHYFKSFAIIKILQGRANFVPIAGTLLF